MSGPSPDTWHHRDLPVLRTVVEGFDAGSYGVHNGPIMKATGLDSNDVRIAVRALENDGLLEAQYFADGTVMFVSRITGEARRKAGSWPTPESGVDRLIAALENLAEHGTDDERSRARKILDALGGAGQQIAVSVASAVITGQVT